MRKGRRQSSIINNFFTLASIIIIAVTLTLYVKYIVPQNKQQKQNPNPRKNLPVLACQKETSTSFKVFNQNLVDSSLKALNSGYYKLSGGYIEAVYSKSNIKRFISIEELDSFYETSIGIKSKKDIKKYLTINYEIIENDRKNPNNKTKKNKLYSGSISTSFRAGSKEIFMFYTDFRLYDKNEIKNRIDCAIRTYKHYAK